MMSERSSILSLPAPAAPRRSLSDRARKSLLGGGGAALSDSELVGVLLPGTSGAAAAELAGQLLVARGGLAGLLHAGGAELALPGIGPAGRAAVLAAVELGRRLARAQLPQREVLDFPKEVARYVALRYSQPDQEVLGALYLNLHNHLLCEHELYRGTLTRAVVEPRAILRHALRAGASGFVLFHTHPSGDPTPSNADFAFTRRMQKAGEIMGVRLIDHVIVAGGDRWVSLRRRGV